MANFSKKLATKLATRKPSNHAGLRAFWPVFLIFLKTFYKKILYKKNIFTEKVGNWPYKHIWYDFYRGFNEGEKQYDVFTLFFVC